MATVPEWPHLGQECRETSPATTDYNCIAWAAGDTKRWWWPNPALTYYWPVGAPRTLTLDAFARAYSALGYEPCANSNLEADFEKVAIYVDSADRPTHAARQLPDGRWTSKLGNLIDIEHANLECLRGLYGRVALVVRRSRFRSQTLP